MLKTIAASVAASQAAATMLVKNVKVIDEQPTDVKSNVELASCACGCSRFWLPVGHRDVASSYRCADCFPAPSKTLVAKSIDVDLIDVPTFEIMFNAGEPACFRCGGSLVAMNQNGYFCGTCVSQIPPSVSRQLWGAM